MRSLCALQKTTCVSLLGACLASFPFPASVDWCTVLAWGGGRRGGERRDCVPGRMERGDGGEKGTEGGREGGREGDGEGG
jgi:hypothetical protein